MAFHPFARLRLHDLHVRTATALHHGFPWLRRGMVKFTTFRVPWTWHALETLSDGLRDRRSLSAANLHWHNRRRFAFTTRSGFTRCDHATCQLHRLLGPCFKTGRDRHWRNEFRPSSAAVLTRGPCGGPADAQRPPIRRVQPPDATPRPR